MSNEAFPIGVLVLLVTLAVRKYRAHSKEQAALKRGTQLVSNIHFDTAGWQLCETSPSASSWVTDEGDALTLHCGAGPGEVSPPDDLAAIRAYAREVAASSGGTLVWADRRTCGGVPAVAFIYKREQLPAYAYTGMIMIDADERHFVIAMASVERGMTGVRDALVTARLLESGRLNPTATDARGRVAGWFRDPYDSSLDAESLASVADDQQYDELVPSHPLSKIRRFFQSFEQTLRLDDMISSDKGRPTMNQAEITDFANRYAAAWSSQTPASLAAFYAEDGSLTVNSGAASVGRAAITATVKGFMAAFPDMVVKLKDVGQEGPHTVFRWIWTGTNTGPGGTGKQVRIEGYEEWTLGANGLIASSEGHYDEAEYARQLQVGAPPAP